MDWNVLLCLFIVNATPIYTRRGYQLQRLLNLIKRRNLLDDGILGVPEYPEDLPRAERILPGHTLLKPTLGMLKSSVKFPHKDVGKSVYGDLENLGITYGNTNERILYTNFRKANDLLSLLLGTNRNKKGKQTRNPIVVYIRNNPKYNNIETEDTEKVSEEENNASEILDDLEIPERSDDKIDLRRSRAKMFRDRSSSSAEYVSEGTGSSGSSDYERNPGNPFTVHKDKYRQNWIWNHFMDGDHMNVNPYAPQFNSLGPSGTALFFNRKWWYYNQDDYRPFD